MAKNKTRAFTATTANSTATLDFPQSINAFRGAWFQRARRERLLSPPKCVKKGAAAAEKAMTQHEGFYELLDHKGERVGTCWPTLPLGWFAYVNGNTASNACLETSKHAFEELEDTVKRYGLSVKQPTHAD